MQLNFAHLLESTARRFWDKTTLVWDGGSLTWSELDRLASGFAASLSRRGVTAGDRVAMVIPNRWTFAAAFLGILKLGATASPLHPTLKTEEKNEILADLRPKLVIDDVEMEGGDWTTPERATAPAVIVYTSGSTGRPKGAVFSHEALAHAIESWGGPVMALKPEDVVLAVLPLAHNYGMNGALLAPLLFGASVALVERFTPEAVFDAIKRYRVTVFPGVATIFRRLLGAPDFVAADFSSLRFALSGAAPCPWELAQEWRDKTGIRILRGYGMTEVPRPISYLADDPRDFPDAVGRAVPGVEVRVVDEAGGALVTGEVGELWIKSPFAMDGYLDAPEETAAVVAEGWFKTGDLAIVTPEGFIRIVGRKRERILRGGYSVFPQEVEAVLLSHPAVAEAAVVGIQSADLGEEVAAFVTLKPAVRTTTDELSTYCQERLAHYKYPRQVSILQEMPRGATGKILKSELVKLKAGG